MATVASVFWHRQLPPIDAEMMAEHFVEANSGRVPGTLAHRDDLWDDCYQELMVNAESRISDEITRLGGDYAHVRSESLGAKHDDVAGEAWLHGTFTYNLYRRAGHCDGAVCECETAQKKSPMVQADTLKVAPSLQ